MGEQVDREQLPVAWIRPVFIAAGAGGCKPDDRTVIFNNPCRIRRGTGLLQCFLPELHAPINTLVGEQ
jgi:hypothetical protein